MSLSGLLALVAVAGGVAFLEGHVSRVARGRIFDIDTIPARPIAMVLGAKASAGAPSSFLAARLDLALELYRRGKVTAVLVSGDNTASSEHETTVMRQYLVERGIPAEKVVEDPAGFDTYDSCVRARDVFGVQEMIVLTQLYHLERAITICSSISVDAVGVGDVSTRHRLPDLYSAGERREWGANMKMVWDVLSRRTPRQDPFNDTLLRAAAL
ncbi:MAG: SanA/YdcF family protein [Arachnia sp.]